MRKKGKIYSGPRLSEFIPAAAKEMKKKKQRKNEFLIYGQVFDAKDILENIPPAILKKLTAGEKRAIIKAIKLTLEAYEQAAEDKFLEKILT